VSDNQEQTLFKILIKAYPELEEEDIVQAIKYAVWTSSEKIKVIPMKETVNARTCITRRYEYITINCTRVEKKGMAT